MVLDQEALLAYRQRWQVVAQLNDTERQRDTVTERWHKLNSLLRMAVALGLYPNNIESETLVLHQRWNRLRQMGTTGGQEALL